MAARIRAAVLACALVAVAGMSAQARPLQQTTGVDVHGLGGTGAKAAATGIGRQTDHRQVRMGRHSADDTRRRGHAVRPVVSVDRGCLTPDTRAVLDAAERHFNVRFALVSTCRPGAVIAGTRHASQHRYGRAVDLNVPRGTSKAAVVKWLYANAPGVTMIYRNMSHVHFDTGPYHKLACGGCSAPKRLRYAHAR